LGSISLEDCFLPFHPKPMFIFVSEICFS
jgi:hypothetical protein